MADKWTVPADWVNCPECGSGEVGEYAPMTSDEDGTRIRCSDCGHTSWVEP